MLIIELLKMNCRECAKELWALIRSQEEFTEFRCSSCFVINKEKEVNHNGQVIET